MAEISLRCAAIAELILVRLKRPEEGNVIHERQSERRYNVARFQNVYHTRLRVCVVRNRDLLIATLEIVQRSVDSSHPAAILGLKHNSIHLS